MELTRKMLHAPTLDSRRENAQAKSLTATHPAHVWSPSGAATLSRAADASEARAAVAPRTSIGPASSTLQGTLGNQAVLRLLRRSARPPRGVIQEAAAGGVRGPSGALPHLERIQQSFGRYDITNARAHTGESASRAAQSINASAYTFGDHVAFDGHPDLYTAAHEAAHVVQQRAGVLPGGGVGEAGDRFERHADAVAARVVEGRTAEPLLGRVSDLTGSTLSGAPGAAVQRQEEKKKAHAGVADAMLGAAVNPIINMGLAKVDETLLEGSKQVRLAVRDDTEFQNAWAAYCERSGVPVSNVGDNVTGFVDPTHPNGKTGFVRANLGIGTLIHEALHQRAHSSFTGRSVSVAVNEGTTELFTRVILGYAGSQITRTAYPKETVAMLRLQGISGLKALAQWYFRNDQSGVEKALGAKFTGFMEFMRAADVPQEKDTNIDSAINLL